MDMKNRGILRFTANRLIVLLSTAILFLTTTVSATVNTHTRTKPHSTSTGVEVKVKGGINYHELDNFINAQNDGKAKFFKTDGDTLIISKSPIILKKPSYQPKLLADLGYGIYIDLQNFTAFLRQIPYFQLVNQSAFLAPPIPVMISLPQIIPLKPMIDIVWLWKFVTFSIFVVGSILFGCILLLGMSLQAMRVRNTKPVLSDVNSLDMINDIVRKGFHSEQLNISNEEIAKNKDVKIEKDLI